MFENLNPWAWVAFAWLELVIAYGGYFLYLQGRARRLEEAD
jgi:hypothetical protein